MSRKILIKLVIYLILIIVAFVYLYPLIYAFNASLKTNREFMVNPMGFASSLQWSNYVEAWQRADFSMFFFNSLFYTVINVAAVLIMSVFVAFPLARGYLGKLGKIVFWLFLISMFLPDGTIPRFIGMLNVGLYNTRLGYILVGVGARGLFMLVFIDYIKGLPRELDEAASIDGCGYFRYMASVMFPLMKPALASMAILQVNDSWNEYLNAVIYLSNRRLFPITRGLVVFTGAMNVEWPLRIASLVIVAVPIIILYVFLQKYIIESQVNASIKG